MRQIRKILVANRGEIAVRIMRTARSMGISSVAVFSDADRDALHVRSADEAIWIGAAPSRESYLNIERIVEAALRSGADAVHPGYGFLSEREVFAQAVIDAGLAFVGPSPAAIAAMGKKREAKETAMAAGVPVVPGYNGTDQNLERLAAECARIGFPVLIKASAGGGGKGMRICRRPEDVTAALEGAQREALGAFGDDTLILEKYIERPRHVEVQILGDQHGNLLHLFERECSIQRRHQKIIEETPSTALSPELRAKMGRSAVSIGKAIGYTNAGTVEFIVDPTGAFYFLEVNTRLQVEHPITECVTGLDLVREQIRIARGEPLGYGQEDVRMRGAALECRVYAEDPSQGFLPQSGRLVDFDVPKDMPWLRVDAGVETDSEVSIHYDPLLAKVITHGADRVEATQRMLYALERLQVHGIANNRGLLIDLLQHPEYTAGRIHTHFIEEQLDGGRGSPPSEETLQWGAVAVALHGRTDRADSPLPGVRGGFRNNPWLPQRVAYEVGERSVEVQYTEIGAAQFRVTVAGRAEDVRIVRETPREMVLEMAGRRRSARAVVDGDRHFVQIGGVALSYREQPRFPELDAGAPEGGYLAPMPGKIVKIDVAVGAQVARGQRLLVMEAMKMEHAITANTDGEIEAVLVSMGEQVDAQRVLVVVRSPA